MKKHCPKCNLNKSISEFFKDKTNLNGLDCWCKKCRKEYKINYYKKNKKIINLKNRIYKKLFLNTIKTQLKAYYEKNKVKILKYYKSYRILKRKLLSKKQIEYRKNKLKIDINFRILYNLRARLKKALKRNKKTYQTLDFIGCSIEYLKQYLESKFTKGMSWSNYGKWHIDHIKPCASFDLSKPEEQRKCFHYTNLQPLWAKDNIKKSDKWI